MVKCDEKISYMALLLHFSKRIPKTVKIDIYLQKQGGGYNDTFVGK